MTPEQAAALLEATHHVIPRMATGNYPYRGLLDEAVAAARINCWKQPGHGIQYGECCVRAALEVALTPDPARDLWEAEREQLRQELTEAMSRASRAEQAASLRSEGPAPARRAPRTPAHYEEIALPGLDFEEVC